MPNNEDEPKIKVSSLASALVKYIRYIKELEGIDYIFIEERCWSTVEFTDEEWDILERAANNNL